MFWCNKEERWCSCFCCERTECEFVDEKEPKNIKIKGEKEDEEGN